jgi:hypothetical protein
MPQHRRAHVTLLGFGLLAVLLVGVLSAYGLQAHAVAPAAANTVRDDGKPDQAVVQTYFQIFNAGLQSGDFSALASVYAPDATLIQSNSKNVVAIKHGVSDIIAWYTMTFGIGTPAHGSQFTPDLRYPAMQSLAPHVVLTYEYALPLGFAQAGYCMHVFTLQYGWIESVHWVTYFGPVK